MEWFFVQSELERCIEKVKMLSDYRNKIEEEAKKIQSAIFTCPTNPADSFARDIYNAVSPIIEKRIQLIQEASINRITKKE